MKSLGLLVGHLLGDYIVQTDWMAANKAAPWPGAEPATYNDLGGLHIPDWTAYCAWGERRSAWQYSNLACTIHCLCYTLAVWACSFWWMPWWGLLVCFLAHWPMDRFRLARRWMTLIGQESFATGPLAPWSVIVVDNTIHLLTLFAIGMLA